MNPVRHSDISKVLEADVKWGCKNKMSNGVNKLLKKSIEEYQRTQDLMYKIQKLSNEIRAGSKKAIALLRRDNIQESKRIISKAENNFRKICKIIKKNGNLTSQSFYKEAVEEYIEAITFYNFLSLPPHYNKNIWFGGKSKKEILDFVKVEPEEVISGICDFTGEVVRRAVTTASVDNFEKLLTYKKTIEDIVEELTKIGFRGKIRQKYDETERNLRKIENIVYDIKLKNPKI